MSVKPSELWTEVKNSHTIKRALLIYMIVTTVMFMLILIVTVNQTITSNNKQWQLEAHESIKQAQSMNNVSVRNISDYMQQQMDTYDVLSLLYSADYSMYQRIRVRDVYEQLANISSLVKNVQLINFQTKTIIDHNGRFPFEYYGDRGLFTLLESLTPSHHTRIYYYPRMMNTSAVLNKPNEQRVISMIYYLNRAGALVVNLDYELYKGMIVSAKSHGPTEYYLINERGTIFCATDDDVFAANMQEDALYQKIAASKESSNSFRINNRGVRQEVSYIRSMALGATYIAVTDISGVYVGSPMFWQIMGLSLMFLLLSALISIFLALLISRPIRTLHRSVKEQLAGDFAPEEEVDEITFLHSVYQSMLNSNRELTENSRIYQMERENQMLLNMMNPVSPSLHASAAAVAELETKFSRPCFRVITLMPGRSQIQMETDAQAIRRNTATTALEILRGLGTVRTVFPPSFKVVFLLNMDAHDEASIRQTMSRVLAECKQALGGMPLYMGVGKEMPALEDIDDSYSGAEEAVQQAYIHQAAEPVYADDLVFPDLNVQTYAFDLDEQITHAIRHMEKDRAEEAILAFFERVTRFHHNQFVRSTLHLDVVLQRLEISLQLESTDNTSHIDTTTVMRWNAQDACQFFIHRAQLDIAQLQDMKKPASPNNELISQINQMIDDNILNPDFSIVQLADAFSFSVNYLRSLYKNGSGESLSARITRKRVEAACALLDNTDESIEAITEKLGFSTRNYFFTFFKKHMGMTPAQYRNR